MAVERLSGVELCYETRGAGEALLLIPGFASGAWSWEWQTEELSRNFQVITFDPRGVSRSKIIEGAAVSIDSIADDVAKLLGELGIDAAHILGISFGGFVAQEFALRFPTKMQKLVLASTSFGGPNHVAPSTEVLEAFASTEGLNSAARIRHYLAAAFSPNFGKIASETVDRFCELREQNSVPANVYLQQLRSAMSFDAEARVSGIEVGTLVITGDSDAVVPVQNSENLAAAIPNARLEIINGAGHMAFVEKAGEFNGLVRDFLLE